MRLICPNCDAQYEVGDDAIPEGGRDVQCSNCGHAWFQLRPEAEEAQADEEELFGAPGDVTSPPAEAAPVPSGDQKAAEAAEEEPAAFAPPEPLARRPLGDDILSVLREEAERESAARRSEEPQPVEVQPDLGLDAAADTAASRRIAEMKGIAPEPAPESAAEAEPEPARAPKGRDLLPDIEEINSTLRASSERGDDAGHDQMPEVAVPGGRSGFRSGFVLTMLVAVVLAMAYVMAPRIAQQIPGSADTITAYVQAVDSARIWLDGMVQKASSAVRDLSGT